MTSGLTISEDLVAAFKAGMQDQAAIAAEGAAGGGKLRSLRAQMLGRTRHLRLERTVSKAADFA